MRNRFFAASLILAAAQPLAAQFPTDVAVGSRVRVLLPDSVRQAWGPRLQSVHGEVAGVATDTLAGAFWIGLIALAAERSGRGWDDDVATSAAIGAGIGFVLGAIFPTERWRRVSLR